MYLTVKRLTRNESKYEVMNNEIICTIKLIVKE